MTSQFSVINKILNNKDMSLVNLNNLDDRYFFNYKSEFSFIKNHYDLYKCVPDKITFAATFPEFDFVEVTEPDSFLLEQLYKDYNTSYLASRFNTIKKMLENDKTDEAIQYFINSTENLHTGKVMTCTDLLKDTSRYDRYVDRIADHDRAYLTTGFPQLDQLIGGIDRTNENMVVIARTGVGKCLAKGTKVLMADGTTKAVEEVKIGDRVQSFNTINTVLALHNGISNGYKIIPNKGIPFTVSANHILTLYKYNEVYDKKRHMMTTNGTGELVDIMIEDFIALSNHKKHLYKLIRPAIEYATKEQTIAPYMLGLWLGDGISSQAQICSADPEIVEAIYNYGTEMGYVINKLPSHAADSAPVYSFTELGKNNKYFRTELQELQLLNNKHIPLNYLTGDKQQRLQLLAGLLDTDGCYMHSVKNEKISSMFDFTNKNKTLFDQVAQLARGLGFKVCIPKSKKIKVGNEVTEYYRMNISGELQEIPTKIARKQAVKTNHQNSLLDGFKIEPIDTVNYYGFEADGDHRYLLADNTLTHNTQVLLKMAATAAMQGLTVGIYEGEMTADKVGYRIDTFIGHIKNTSLNRGDAFIQKQYKTYIDSLAIANYGAIKVFTPTDVPTGEVTVDTLKTFIEKEKLDILFVDQYDLLDDKRGAKVEYERIANIARDIKLLQVEKQIPIIAVSQMNRTKSEEDANKNKIQDTTQVAGSDKIPRYATTIIALDQKMDETAKQVRLTLNIIKARDGGDHNKLVYGVNFNTGEFIYIPSENDKITTQEDLEEINNRYSVDNFSEDYI